MSSQSLIAVRGRLNTVKSIRKITKAMKLISTSRFARYKSLYDANITFLNAYKECMEICLEKIDYDNNIKPTCLVKNNGNSNLYILITSSLGLCGGYTIELEKIGMKNIKSDDDVLFVGEKGYAFFKDKIRKSYTEFIDLMDDLTFDNVNLLRHFVDKIYRENQYGSVSIIYMSFFNSFIVEPTIRQLLPLDIEKIRAENKQYRKENNLPINGEDGEDYAKVVSDKPTYEEANLIVPHYLDALLYHLFLESYISEQTSRRNSMENATNSADDLLDDLHLQYNKIRQQKITNELTEIIAGTSD